MVIGPTRIGMKAIGVLIKFIFRYWWIFITLLVLSSAIISSINEGIEQEDWSIPLKDLGLFLVVADFQVYETVQELKNMQIDEISWDIIKNLLIALWMLFFNFMFFYKFLLFVLGDASRKRRAVLLSILTMAGLQILVSGIPFRGIFELGKFVINTVGGL